LSVRRARQGRSRSNLASALTVVSATPRDQTHSTFSLIEGRAMVAARLMDEMRITIGSAAAASAGSSKRRTERRSPASVANSCGSRSTAWRAPPQEAHGASQGHSSRGPRLQRRDPRNEPDRRAPAPRISGVARGAQNRLSRARPCTPLGVTNCLQSGANPACLRGLRYFQHVQPQGPYGIRTRAAAVRGRCPRPLDEWAVANGECSGRPSPFRLPERVAGAALREPVGDRLPRAHVALHP
jgi:hypothetical protein